MRQKAKEPVKKIYGLRPVIPCRRCGAEVFAVRGILLDAEYIPYVEPVPGRPTVTLYSINGWDFPATAGEDIPDYVEVEQYGFRKHRCRRAESWKQEAMRL